MVFMSYYVDYFTESSKQSSELSTVLKSTLCSPNSMSSYSRAHRVHSPASQQIGVALRLSPNHCNVDRGGGSP